LIDIKINDFERPKTLKIGVFIDFFAILDCNNATHISKVNCAKMAWDRPRQPAYGIFSIKRRFLQFKFRLLGFKEGSAHGHQKGVPYKKSLFCRCWLV